jgi:hypothetical protein
MSLAPTPFMILHARAQARAILFDAGDYASLREATAPLVDYAHDSGIVEQAGNRGGAQTHRVVFSRASSSTINE